MANIDNAKQWFKTGMYPTQAQFYQVFEWLRWKDEKLQIQDITNLQNILNGIATLPNIKALFRDEVQLTEDGIWMCPADTVITGMVIKSTGAAVINAGFTPGGDELFSWDVEADEPLAISLFHYTAAERPIHLSGISSNTTIIILKNPA